MRRVKLLMLALVAVAMLVAGSSPAVAQGWVQHPMTGAWVWCEYYGSEYWCWFEDTQTGIGTWTRALPGWQGGSLGG